MSRPRISHNRHPGWPWDEIYVVNMKSSRDRWETIEKSLRANGINTKDIRYDAVVGKNLDLHQMIEDGKILRRWFEHSGDRAAKPGGIGQYMSMIGVFKDALLKGHERILFLEDDQVLKRGFKQKFWQAYNELPADWDIFYLATNETPSAVPKIPGKKHLRKCFENDRTRNKDGNQGFIINRKAMKEFINRSFPIRDASDVFLIYEIILEGRADAYVAYPYLIKEFDTPSTIG